MDRKTKINIWYIVAALAGFMLVQGFYPQSKQYTTIPYSQFQTLLDQNNAIRGLVGRAFDRAIEILNAHRPVHETTAQLLLQKETLEEDDLGVARADRPIGRKRGDTG